MPSWGRILLGGLGCCVLAWGGLLLDARLGGMPLWLADALLIFLVLHGSGAALAATLAAGAAGIMAGHWLNGAAAPATFVHGAAAIVEALIARWALARFAPGAMQLENAGALVRLLLWGAALPPVAGAALVGLDDRLPDRLRELRLVLLPEPLLVLRGGERLRRVHQAREEDVGVGDDGRLEELLLLPGHLDEQVLRPAAQRDVF